MQIIGMLSAQNIFYRPREKQAQADQKKAKFFQPEGDHMTLLAVYEGWKTSKFSKPWAYENFIQERSLKRAQRPASQANVVRNLSSSARLAAEVELTIDGKKVSVEGMHHTSNAPAAEVQC